MPETPSDRFRIAPTSSNQRIAALLVWLNTYDATLNGTGLSFSDAVSPTGEDYNRIFSHIKSELEAVVEVSNRAKPHVGVFVKSECTRPTCGRESCDNPAHKQLPVLIVDVDGATVEFVPYSSSSPEVVRRITEGVAEIIRLVGPQPADATFTVTFTKEQREALGFAADWAYTDLSDGIPCLDEEYQPEELSAKAKQLIALGEVMEKQLGFHGEIERWTELATRLEKAGAPK